MADKKEITQAGIEKEIRTLEITLAAKVGRTAITLEEYITLRQSQGVGLEVIRESLLKDLEEGGRIFGEFKKGLKSSWAGSTSRFRDVGELAELGLDGNWRWVAVLVNTCPDCLQRHNQVKTWNEWEAEGVPRANATVCEQYCQCVLMPEESTELEPVKRKK